MATREELYDAADQLKEDGKLDEAVAKMCELVEQFPDYALAHSALAVIYGRLSEHEKAIGGSNRSSTLEDAFEAVVCNCNLFSWDPYFHNLSFGIVLG